MVSSSYTTYYCLLALAGSALALPQSSFAEEKPDYSVFEELATVPRGWKRTAEPDPRSHIRLKIHMRQQNPSVFEKRLVDISTPSHSLYGDHMSYEQIQDMMKPSDEAMELVKRWLDSHGVSDRATFDNDWVHVDTTLGDASKLLNANYAVYKRGSDTVVRTTAYSLPRSLHNHIRMVQPTTMFGRASAMKSDMIKNQADVDNPYAWPPPPPKSNKPYIMKHTEYPTVPFAACNYSITPDCLSELYQFKEFEHKAHPRNVLGINGFLEQWPQYEDLNTFMKTYKSDLNAPKADIKTGTVFDCIPVHDGECTQNPPKGVDFGEANLDIQYTVGLTYPTKNTYYSTGGRPPMIPDANTGPYINISSNFNEPYLDWLHYILKQKDLPSVITTSYGEDEQTVPKSYAESVCNLFGQLGARGVSVIFSSGDSGPGIECVANDGKNTTQFIPNFPASCPWVTSVGGTYNIRPERAPGFSSGGFSNYFSRPSYQDSAVCSYLEAAEAKKYSKFYNSKGRAIPDVSAQSVNFHVTMSGEDINSVDGTSASGPVVAAIVSLVNSDRLAKGGKPLGFLNPWIYSTAQQAGGWKDIVDGAGLGCMNQIKGGASIAAIKGWDPVTGLGTPVFPKLLEAGEDYTGAGLKKAQTSGVGSKQTRRWQGRRN